MVTYRPVWQLCLIFSCGTHGCSRGASTLNSPGVALYTDRGSSQFQRHLEMKGNTYLGFYHHNMSLRLSGRSDPRTLHCSSCHAAIRSSADPHASFFALQGRHVHSIRTWCPGITNGRDLKVQSESGKAPTVSSRGAVYPKSWKRCQPETHNKEGSITYLMVRSLLAVHSSHGFIAIATGFST